MASADRRNSQAVARRSPPCELEPPTGQRLPRTTLAIAASTRQERRLAGGAATGERQRVARASVATVSGTAMGCWLTRFLPTEPSSLLQRSSGDCCGLLGQVEVLSGNLYSPLQRCQGPLRVVGAKTDVTSDLDEQVATVSGDCCGLQPGLLPVPPRNR